MGLNMSKDSRKQPGRTAKEAKEHSSLLQFFRESPLVGLELEFERNKDISRDIDLFEPDEPGPVE